MLYDKLVLLSRIVGTSARYSKVAAHINHQNLSITKFALRQAYIVFENWP